MKTLSPTHVGSLGLAVRGRNLNWFVICAVGLFFLLLTAPMALAQEATILGTVTDPTGANVPNAAIAITNVDTGIVRNTTTNTDGQYVAPDLIIGHYSVKASATGFKVAEEKGIKLDVGDRTRIDFKLQVGSAQEQITVEANAVAVQTDTGEVSNVITGQQITQLGTNGRSMMELMALVPGASSLQASNIAFTPVSADNSISVNGQRAVANLFLVDGGESLDRGGSQSSVQPSLDAIAEFRNMTSNYSAEYGLSTGAQISTVVKSGTKEFHGEAWEFFRNDDLNARNYFNPAPLKVAEFRYNIFGFNFGGKIPGMNAHPTFFFYNQEWRREIQGGLLNTVVPPSSEYPGTNGAAVLTTAAKDPCDGVICNTGAVVPDSIQFANCPGGVAPTGVVPGSAFPGNTIPKCMISANAAALLTAGGKYSGIFPAPNATNSSGVPIFLGGNNAPTNLTEEIVRIDHTFSSKFSIFGHWISEQIAQTFGTTMWSGDNDPAIGNTFGNPSYSVVIHATHVISPTLLNEIAFNYNGNRIHILPAGLISAPSSFTFNRLFTGPNTDSRIPAIDLGGTTGTDYTINWTPWNNAANDYQIRDDLSWTKGTQQLKFGFSWALYKKVQNAFADTEGQFTFNGLFSGYDFADYLLGYASSYSEDGAQINGHWNNVSPAAYVQDNWRATRRLTLNLGLRWDGIPHAYEANHLSSNFYPSQYSATNALTPADFWNNGSGNICSGTATATSNFGCTAAAPGLVAESAFGGYQFYLNGIGIGGLNGNPKGLVDNYWKNFGPRLGFAYDLTGQGKTVIRGGYGVMYERIQGNDMYNGATNPPGDPSPTLHNVSLQNPGEALTGPAAGSVITAANLPVLPLGVTGISTNYPPPRSSQYSLGVQQAIGPNAVLSVSYVGSQGRRLNYYQEVNLPPLTALPNDVATGTLNFETLTYPGFGNMKLAFDGANSRYNSLQMSVNGKIHRDLHLQVGYTAARAKDETTGTGSGGDLNNATNPFVGPSYDWGPSVYNRNNVFYANFVYDLPFFHDANHLTKGLLGGWELAAIITAESGAPVNVGVTGPNASSVVGNSGDRPYLTGSITYPKSVAHWFTGNFTLPSAANGYCLTGPDCYGNVGFDAVTGPGRQNWDLSLLKNFAFTEKFKMEFRVEAFNLWNHPQFEGNADLGGISNNVGSANFGAVTGAYDPRELQLGLKFIF